MVRFVVSNVHAVARGWVWRADIQGDELFPYGEPHQRITTYDPSETHSLLPDFAAVGRKELADSGSPNVINPQTQSEDARTALEEFCLEYGPPIINPDTQLAPLFRCRVAAARFAAAWAVWKALSAVNPDLSRLPIEDTGDIFGVFDWRLDRPASRLALPVGLDKQERRAVLLRYWLSMVVWVMWDDALAPAPVVRVKRDGSGFDPARRYQSLLGFILQKFVGTVTSGVEIRDCQHPLCRREFIAERRNQDHCSRKCTEAHKQWRLRHRS